MTCIVGIETDGKVIIGGDSAGVGGYSLHIRADTKVFHGEQQSMVFGFTTSFRMGQLIRYKLELPTAAPHLGPRGECAALDRWMCTDFIDAVRACLSGGGWLTKKEEREDGGTFLVGVRGKLYRIGDDFQIGRTDDGYTAVGCGADLALGSLHSTRRRSAEARVNAALEAAAYHSAGVQGPFYLVIA